MLACKTEPSVKLSSSFSFQHFFLSCRQIGETLLTLRQGHLWGCVWGEGVCVCVVRCVMGARTCTRVSRGREIRRVVYIFCLYVERFPPAPPPPPLPGVGKIRGLKRDVSLSLPRDGRFLQRQTDAINYMSNDLWRDGYGFRAEGNLSIAVASFLYPSFACIIEAVVSFTWNSKIESGF